GPTGGSGECCALDERECLRDGGWTDGVDRRRHRPVVPGAQCRGHEKLGSIRRDLRRRGRGVGAVESTDRAPAVDQEREVTVIEASVGYRRLVKRRDAPPEIRDEAVAHVAGTDFR